MPTLTRQPYARHTDDVVTRAVKTALGLPLGNEHENIAVFVDTLLASRGFSDKQHYFRVFGVLSEVNTGLRTVEHFAAWFDETFPGKGVWKEEYESKEQAYHYSAFGEEVSDWRTERGLTRTALANLVGVAPSQISRWEEGRGIPSNHGFLNLGRALGINPAKLWAIAHGQEF